MFILRLEVELKHTKFIDALITIITPSSEPELMSPNYSQQPAFHPLKIGRELMKSIRAGDDMGVRKWLAALPPVCIPVEPTLHIDGAYVQRMLELKAAKRALAVPFVGICVDLLDESLRGEQGIYEADRLRSEVIERLVTCPTPLMRIELLFGYVNSHLTSAVISGLEDLTNSSTLHMLLAERCADYLREHQKLTNAWEMMRGFQLSHGENSLVELLVVDIRLGLSFAMFEREALFRVFTKAGADRNEVHRALEHCDFEVSFARNNTTGSARYLDQILRSPDCNDLCCEGEPPRLVVNHELRHVFNEQFFELNGVVGERKFSFSPALRSEHIKEYQPEVTVGLLFEKRGHRGCPALVDDNVRRLTSLITPALQHPVMLDFALEYYGN